MWVGTFSTRSSGGGPGKSRKKKTVGRMEHNPVTPSQLLWNSQVQSISALALCIWSSFDFCTLLMHELFFRKWQLELSVTSKWVPFEMNWERETQIQGKIERKEGESRAKEKRHFNNRNDFKKKIFFFLLWSFQQLNEAMCASWFDLSARPHVRLLRLRVFPERSNEPFYDSLSHCWFLLPSLQTF